MVREALCPLRVPSPTKVRASYRLLIAPNFCFTKASTTSISSKLGSKRKSCSPVTGLMLLPRIPLGICPPPPISEKGSPFFNDRGKLEYYIACGLNSKLDGDGIRTYGRPSLNLVIVLDISGSMSGYFSRGTTCFLQSALETNGCITKPRMTLKALTQRRSCRWPSNVC